MNHVVDPTQNSLFPFVVLTLLLVRARFSWADVELTHSLAAGPNKQEEETSFVRPCIVRKVGTIFPPTFGLSFVRSFLREGRGGKQSTALCDILQ